MIQIGDYIEGYELIGPKEFPKVHKMRIVVSNIKDLGNKVVYSGKADDWFGGSRGGTVSSDLGEVRVITDEKPFEETSFDNKWWKRAPIQVTSLKRDWDINTVVRKADGKLYIILGEGINRDTLQSVIIYKELHGKKIYTELRESFESLNTEYPEDDQVWKFEKVYLNEVSNNGGNNTYTMA